MAQGTENIIFLLLLVRMLYLLVLISVQTICSHLSHHWQRIASSPTSLLQIIKHTCFVFLPLFFSGLFSADSLRFPAGVAIGDGSINAHF